ncbi:hypothetical protein CNR22_12525 [Sphingobacteriaceae bacterium]|nr:hypothetical protein CNR22_12525 [Sphingobacteriaceae bacterium]
MQGKVSIIIPCYNASSFIVDTLKSIQEQSYSNYEIIVVDDGSTDASKELVNEFKAENLTYLFQKNKGVSAARNKGCAVASGDYYLFVDADDVLDKDFIKQRVEELDKNKEILFACSAASLINEKGEELGIEYAPVCDDVELEICTYKSNYCSCPSNYLIRKEFKERGILFEEKLSNSADRFFLLQLNKLGKGIQVNGNCKLKYRIHSKSMSKNISPKNIRDLVLFYALVVENKLVPSRYALALKLKTFRISFTESLLIKNFRLAIKVISQVLLKG